MPDGMGHGGMGGGGYPQNWPQQQFVPQPMNGGQAEDDELVIVMVANVSVSSVVVVLPNRLSPKIDLPSSFGIGDWWIWHELVKG